MKLVTFIVVVEALHWTDDSIVQWPPFIHAHADSRNSNKIKPCVAEIKATFVCLEPTEPSKWSKPNRNYWQKSMSNYFYS